MECDALVKPPLFLLNQDLSKHILWLTKKQQPLMIRIEYFITKTHHWLLWPTSRTL